MFKTALLSLLLLACLASAGEARRCGAPNRMASPVGELRRAAPEDCGYRTNSPEPEYEPEAGCFYEVQVVFHVIQDSAGNGFVSADTIQDQIEVLNEDFQAIAGSPGEMGRNTRIGFRLATVDPDGNPTTGITYTTNDRWFIDRGGYYDTLNWDSHRYMNVYTNEPEGYYGYVSGFASKGKLVGETHDYVVINWLTVGREPTEWWPGNMGRTGTHEVGHYVGLYHTFEEGCGDIADCRTHGDLICDTNPAAEATDGCPASQETCGNPDPIRNYMDYTNDACIWELTHEQVLRARCTLEHWRPDVYQLICTELDCSDGLDEDVDGLVDCDDHDCTPTPDCGAPPEDCANVIDDDGDGLIDCEDPDCLLDPLEDCDGDGTPNGDDCQPANPSVALPPEEGESLQVINPGSGDAELSWSVVPDALSYDVLSGLLSELWAADRGTDSGGRAPGGEDASSPYSDTRRPPPGSTDGHWFVVRARNPCPGSYGRQSDLVERPRPPLADCR